jgi:hypothetical protein
LTWFAGTVTNVGPNFLNAVRAELERRGVRAEAPVTEAPRPTEPAPAAPVEPVEPTAPLTCAKCGPCYHRTTWQQNRDRRRVIRLSCARCGGFIRFLPQTEESVAEANRNSDPAALLTYLIALDEAGISFERTGNRIAYDQPDRITTAMRDLERQCFYSLLEKLKDRGPWVEAGTLKMS